MLENTVTPVPQCFCIVLGERKAFHTYSEWTVVPADRAAPGCLIVSHSISQCRRLCRKHTLASFFGGKVQLQLIATNLDNTFPGKVDSLTVLAS